METWLAIAVLLLAGVGVIFGHQYEKRRVQRYLQDRAPRSTADFAEHFFQGDAVQLANRLVVILARHLDVDLRRLAPDDRLVDDLRMDQLDSLSTVEFLLDIEKEFGVRIDPVEAERIKTFREVVQLVSRASATATDPA